jgi:hypothetical protein
MILLLRNINLLKLTFEQVEVITIVDIGPLHVLEPLLDQLVEVAEVSRGGLLGLLSSKVLIEILKAYREIVVLA